MVVSLRYRWSGSEGVLGWETVGGWEKHAIEDTSVFWPDLNWFPTKEGSSADLMLWIRRAVSICWIILAMVKWGNRKFYLGVDPLCTLVDEMLGGMANPKGTKRCTWFGWCTWWISEAINQVQDFPSKELKMWFYIRKMNHSEHILQFYIFHFAKGCCILLNKLQDCKTTSSLCTYTLAAHLKNFHNAQIWSVDKSYLGKSRCKSGSSTPVFTAPLVSNTRSPQSYDYSVSENMLVYLSAYLLILQEKANS
jgi:hypothetical protein